MQQSGLCAVCRREPRGFGWFDARYHVSDARRDTSRRQFCSSFCQDLCHQRSGMIDPTGNERSAMLHGAEMAGAYLDSLDRTDLALLSVEEWHMLIEVIVTGYCDHLRALAGRDRGCIDATTPEVRF